MGTTICLRFSDRAEALSVLTTVLGHEVKMDQESGAQIIPTCGIFNGTRYDVSFLADMGVTCGTGEDHVNVLWWDTPETAPDFGTHVVTPATPSCGFAD